MKSPLTRSQWIGAAILILMIISVRLFIHFVPQPEQEDGIYTYNDSAHIDSMSRKKYGHKYYHKKPYHKDTITILLQPFDPNTADSNTLVHLGLRPWQVSNMLKYRAHNGLYRKKEDIKKLYGMTDSLYAILEPYIEIDTLPWTEKTDTTQRPKYKSRKTDTIMDINTADTTMLQKIRYIGPYVAKHIVRYRSQLGGYVSPAQIKEIPSLQRMDRDSNIAFYFDSILPHLIVVAPVQTIPVNNASIDRLMRHPYIHYPQAEKIYTYRRRHVKIKDINELRNVLPDSLFQRIHPYLRIEE